MKILFVPCINKVILSDPILSYPILSYPANQGILLYSLRVGHKQIVVVSIPTDRPNNTIGHNRRSVTLQSYYVLCCDHCSNATASGSYPILSYPANQGILLYSLRVGHKQIVVVSIPIDRPIKKIGHNKQWNTIAL